MNIPTTLPPGLTIDIIYDGAERSMFGRDTVGYCVNCGCEHDSCEPDAERYECYDCGEDAVYGAELLLVVFA